MEIERKVNEDFEFYVKFLVTKRQFAKKEDTKLVEVYKILKIVIFFLIGRFLGLD